MCKYIHTFLNDRYDQIFNYSTYVCGQEWGKRLPLWSYEFSAHSSSPNTRTSMAYCSEFIGMAWSSYGGDRRVTPRTSAQLWNFSKSLGRYGGEKLGILSSTRASYFAHIPSYFSHTSSCFSHIPSYFQHISSCFPHILSYFLYIFLHGSCNRPPAGNFT